MVSWLILIGLFVGTLWVGWTFRAENSAPVDIELIWIHVPRIELWSVILIAMSAGAILSALLLGFAWLRQRLLSGRYRRAIKRLETELHEMRSLPLASHRSGKSGAIETAEAKQVVAPESGAVAEQA